MSARLALLALAICLVGCSAEGPRRMLHQALPTGVAVGQQNVDAADVGTAGDGFSTSYSATQLDKSAAASTADVAGNQPGVETKAYGSRVHDTHVQAHGVDTEVTNNGAQLAGADPNVNPDAANPNGNLAKVEQTLAASTP
ncbi:hypothetical protein WJX72_007048 [[Myrmecia] bisecta]|uniref:Lipoprotein n=1 Tax=[Myrmecia] bisecta TaxID=41462 RepID=A0AAW1R780_9CHLO